MARHFSSAANEYMVFNAGGAANVGSSGIVIATIWRATTVAPLWLIQGRNSSGQEVWSVNPYSDGFLYFAVNGNGFSKVTSYAANTWYLTVLIKAPGSTGAVKGHQYNFATNTWTHESFGTRADPVGGPLSTIQVGRANSNPAEDLNGDLAVMGLWNGGSIVTMTDAQIEAAGLQASIGNWLALAPASLWSFDQIPPTAQQFYTDTDLIGTGEFFEPTVSLATEFTVPNGLVNRMRWRFPAVNPAVTPVVRLYDENGDLVTGSNIGFDTSTLDRWNWATFASPLVVVAGTYRATVVTTRYTARSGFFSSGSITRNGITAVQGVFAGGDTRPVTGSSASYLVDIDFTSFPVVPDRGSAGTATQTLIRGTSLASDPPGFSYVTSSSSPHRVRVGGAWVTVWPQVRTSGVWVPLTH